MATEPARNHRWRFFRAGGFDQVRLDRGDDLLALDQLDQKLWVALSCPTQALEFDDRTLKLIDADNDGRIRAPDLIAAVKWTGARLKSADDLVKRKETLPLDAIDDSTDEGKQLVASGRRLLANLGKPDATELAVSDTADTVAIFAKTRFNGDGVIPVTSADDPDTRAAIVDILASVGGEADRGGALGISTAKVDAFYTAAQAYADWWKVAEDAPETIRPLGAATDEAFDAFTAVVAKIDDFFARVHLAGFDARAAAPLNRDEKEYAILAPALLSPNGDEVASFPLARVEAKAVLPLSEAVNPAWLARIRAFHDHGVAPLLGARTTLSDVEWHGIKDKLAPFGQWRASKAGAVVEPLGIERIRALLTGPAKHDVEALIAEDQALAAESDALASIERLVRYHRDLHRLACNFVSFLDFYSHKTKAIFQAGTLYLDARSCDLCVRVADANAHAGLASLSRTFLAYCDVTRRSTHAKMTIAAAFTAGDSDDLMVGRNGVFYDRSGADWDATIIKIIDHPISVRQAFWLPYKRVGKMIDDQLQKFATARDKEIQDHSAAGVAAAQKRAEEAPNEDDKAVAASATAPAPQPPIATGAAPAPAPAASAPSSFDVAKFAGIFAAIGLAIGAIGSTLAAVMGGFLRLDWWQMPLALAGVMMMVSGPSMLLAWLKLRQRNVGPILDANGWAVNARAKMNIPFGGLLTKVRVLPAGSERSIDDPFEPKKSPWPKIAVVLVLLALIGWLWAAGYLRQGFNELRSLRRPAPSASTSSSAK